MGSTRIPIIIIFWLCASFLHSLHSFVHIVLLKHFNKYWSPNDIFVMLLRSIFWQEKWHFWSFMYKENIVKGSFKFLRILLICICITKICNVVTFILLPRMMHQGCSSAFVMTLLWNLFWWRDTRRTNINDSCPLIIYIHVL